MKIKVITEMTFGMLLPGDVFAFNDRPNEFFMKIEDIDEWVDESSSHTINAIDVVSGEACNECPIEHDRCVKEVDCELVIK